MPVGIALRVLLAVYPLPRAEFVNALVEPEKRRSNRVREVWGPPGSAEQAFVAFIPVDVTMGSVPRLFRKDARVDGAVPLLVARPLETRGLASMTKCVRLRSPQPAEDV